MQFYFSFAKLSVCYYMNVGFSSSSLPYLDENIILLGNYLHFLGKKMPKKSLCNTCIHFVAERVIYTNGPQSNTHFP